MHLNQSEGCDIMCDRDNLMDLAPVASRYDASKATNFKLLLVVLGGKVWMIIIMITEIHFFYRLVH